MQTHRRRTIVVLLGVLALAGVIVALPTIHVAYHRLRLERDFDYFFEIASSAPESHEGRAIRSFLESPAHRATFLDRFVEEVSVISTGFASRRIDTERPLVDELESLELERATLRAYEGEFYVELQHLNGGTWTSGIVKTPELEALHAWLPRCKDVRWRVPGSIDFRVTIEDGPEKPRPRQNLLGGLQWVSVPPTGTIVRAAPSDDKVQSAIVDFAPQPVQQRERLLELLRAGDGNLRSQVVRLLGQLQDRELKILESLVAHVGATSDGSEVALLARRNASTFWPIVDAFVVRLEGGDIPFTESGARLVEVLAERSRHGDDRAIPMILRLLAIDDVPTLAAACEALPRLGARTAVDTLVGHLERPTEFRVPILRALRRLLRSEDLGALAPLRRVLAHAPDPNCRTRAALALASLQETAIPALPDLVGTLSDEDEKPREAAAEAIAEITRRGDLAEAALGPLAPRSR